MKPGTMFVGMVKIYKVQIDGRGGDSVSDEYFETEAQALLASAIDGPNRKPLDIGVLKFSDGTLMFSSFVMLSKPREDEQVAQILETLSPGQKVALGRALEKAQRGGGKPIDPHVC